MEDTRVESVIKNNPQTMERVDALMERLKRLGIQETHYRLSSPFEETEANRQRRSRLFSCKI